MLAVRQKMVQAVSPPYLARTGHPQFRNGKRGQSKGWATRQPNFQKIWGPWNEPPVTINCGNKAISQACVVCSPKSLNDKRPSKVDVLAESDRLVLTTQID